jgi:hypothetical protein
MKEEGQPAEARRPVKTRQGKLVSRFFLIALLALIMAGLGLIVYIFHEPAEPTYNGEPLSYWLAGYGYNLSQANGATPPTRLEADQAVRQMGTNAFPGLLRMLRRHDSPFKARIGNLLHRQHYFNVRLLDPGQDYEAFHAFCALASAASNAVPGLIHLYNTDSSAYAQQAVPAIMCMIGPAARPAVPMLLRATAHTNEVVRNNAVCALGQIHADADKVVPVLVNCLHDPDGLVRAHAIRSIGKFGANARSTIPTLVGLLHQQQANLASRSARNSNPTQRSLRGSWIVGASGSVSPAKDYDTSGPELIEMTQDAIRSIDPEAAAQAGIK